MRAFHNVCRHRAARLLDGPKGHCGKRITCPYHAWTYGLDGRLVACRRRDSFKGLDTARHGLAAARARDLPRLRVRALRARAAERARDGRALRARDDAVPLRGAGAHGARVAAPARGELEERRRQLLRRAAHQRRAPGTHAPVRQGLRHRGAGPGSTRCGARCATRPRSNWSERALPAASCRRCEHLPPERQRLWTYFKLWPNVAFDIYPDQIDFMQFLPLSPTETMIREIAYVHPDAAARCAPRATSTGASTAA